ncbi:antibiotic biosynthesis monooxygenase [Vibrio profundum]|uniref:putative quinol monooxygenase n=1 Tax=Vibrio profundum TaxID=2910247 RepID=UPI003D147540
MPKILLHGHIIVPKEDLVAVVEALPLHIQLTKKEQGCLLFEVLQSQENKNMFSVYEEFIDLESFQLHQNRVKASVWGKVAANVERHYQISEL